MTCENPLNALSPQERAALMDAARERAVALRHDAIDAFWRGAGALILRRLEAGPARLARSTQRLQARLARHRLNRQATALEV
jgi:hypothetical protein